MQLEAGEKLGDYQINEVLGEGSSAIVYRAKHLRVGHQVALKVFRQEISQNKRMLQRIMREARVVNTVSHPNMVEIFDIIEITDRKPPLHVLVMELLQGRTLDDLLYEGALEAEEAVAVASQVANALVALHNQKILHRDIKPQNIFLVEAPDQETRVKVMDLGIAKGVGSVYQTNITQAGQTVGTPEYMAPEHILGKELDERTDIYSLGATIYEMLAGVPPFGYSTEAESFGEFVVELVKSPPPPIHEKKPSVPRALEAVVMRCLSKKPDERYQSVLELREVLLASLSEPSDLGHHLAQDAEARFKPGDKLGGYLITAVIEVGGTSVICSARDPRTGRDVALKVLHPELIQKATTRARFIREAMVVSEIDHPHILKIHDFVEDVEDGEHVFYTVMELLSGKDVATLIREKGPLDPEEAVTIATQVAEALAAVHEAKILHRDLKSENIFQVDQPDGSLRIKLLDFGLVKAFGDRVQVSLTAAGMAVGTPEFMAPEQILGHEMDERTDIYGLGATLYDMLTGGPPFNVVDGNYGEVMVSQIQETPRPVSERRQGGPPVPRALEAVVMRCLEKDPQQRFQSARELHQALEASLDRSEVAGSSLRSVIDRPVTDTSRVRSGGKGWRWLAAALAVVLIVGASLVGAWLVRGGEEVRAPHDNRATVQPRDKTKLGPDASEVARSSGNGEGDGSISIKVTETLPAHRETVEDPQDPGQRSGSKRVRKRVRRRGNRTRRPAKKKPDPTGTLNPFEGAR